MLTLVIQQSFRALGQMQVKWQTLEKPENKRQMYGTVWHEIFAGVLFCRLAFFCVLRDLIFAIWKD